MSDFKNILGGCGLSQTEASVYFGASIDSIKSWCSGRRSVPSGVWQEMQDLFYDLQEAIEIMKLHNDRYEFDDEWDADKIKETFSDCNLPERLPDGAIRQAFSVAKITVPSPRYIQKM